MRVSYDTSCSIVVKKSVIESNYIVGCATSILIYIAPVCSAYTHGCYSRIRFSRNALVTTETELSAMAAPAKTGESSRPKAG